MIVIEGPDGSGKSTLILEITKRLGLKATHLGSRPKTMQDLHDRVIKSQYCEVLDRWSPISERVYGTIANRDWSIDVLDTYLDTYRPLIIYCRPPRGVLLENKKQCLEAVKSHKSKEHCDLVSDNFERVIELYDDAMLSIKARRLGCQIIVYDYTKPKALMAIIKHLEKVRG